MAKIRALRLAVDVGGVVKYVVTDHYGLVSVDGTQIGTLRRDPQRVTSKEWVLTVGARVTEHPDKTSALYAAAEPPRALTHIMVRAKADATLWEGCLAPREEPSLSAPDLWACGHEHTSIPEAAFCARVKANTSL